VLVCLLAAVLSALFWPRRLDVALGVIGGGVLSAVSYWAIRSSVDGLLAELLNRTAAGTDGSGDRGGTGTPRRFRSARFIVRFAGRYALLALLAYAMIARLRLHPVGVLIGVSSVVVAAIVEAVLGLPKRQRSGRSGPTARSRQVPKV
jgi:hypothetical protein